MSTTFKDFLKKTGITEGVRRDGTIKGDEQYSVEQVKQWFLKNNQQVFKTSKQLLDALRTEFNSTFHPKDITQLEKLGFIKKEGRTITISVEPADVKKATTTKVRELSKGVAKKLKIPKGKSSDKLQKFTETVILHMLGQEAGKLLLTGDPGTGKSRTVETVISLLRMQCITIEAPHVSEEAIINIPYLVRRGNDIENNTDTYKSTGENTFEVVNAESNLVTRLKRTRPIKDNEYNQFLKTHKMLIPLYEKYKNVIEKLPYQNVLFIDEYYRTGSKRIQNLFRTILNGNIGDTPIPANTYVIFASNMNNDDGSLDPISLNQQFSKINFDAPSKNDFLRYMADKFTNVDVNTGLEDTSNDSNDSSTSSTDNSDILDNSKTIEENKKENILKPEVYNAFADALTDKDLGSKDMNTEAEIRVSPRRWEEIIKYVNANIPVQNETEARNLLTFLKDNMTDYETQETSHLYDKYSKVIKKLIKETSGIDADNLPVNTKKEWRHTLDNELETKMKLGDDRKYVPIISGAPGIGKTSIIDKIAKDKNLNLITIDASTLNSDDVIGLSTPDDNNGHITTKFSKPPLYNKIMSQYDSDREPVNGSKYTNLLFIDEISRTTSKVFNGIRSLMLDKKVGSEELPKDMMIVCAMNPKDTGAVALSDHLKDVVDVITAEADFNDFIKYMKGKKSLLDMNEKIGFNLSDIIIDMHQQITSLFESETDTEDEELDDFNSRKYYWGADNINIFYVSPREMDDMISGSVTNSVNGLVLFESFDKNNRYNQDDLHKFTNYIIDKTSEKYKEILDFVANDKGNIDPDSFSKLILGVEGKLEETAPKIFNEFNTIKSLATVTIKSIFENVDYNIDTLLNEPTIKPTLENILDSADVDDVKLDFMAVIDDMIKKNTPIELIENLIKMWKLLEMVDWTKFNSEITSNLSVIFVKRGYQPTLNKIVDENNDETFKKLDEIMEKYPEEVEYITSRASSNIYNMFVKSKS